MEESVMATTPQSLHSQQPRSILQRRALPGARVSAHPSGEQFVLIVPVDKDLLTRLQLKATHKTIITYKSNTSGTHWDNVKGANIEGLAAERTFESHLTTKVRTLSC